uniref:Cyclin N-terminal domain-containing protein n=1 Tax=Aegilops tauschii subsp. strangulata TaxID=200361 RepID=A0A453A5T3_AEGTS
PDDVGGRAGLDPRGSSKWRVIGCGGTNVVARGPEEASSWPLPTSTTSSRVCVQRMAMPWVARPISVACVSVAAKMEYCAPALSELDADGSYKFYSASVRRMELLVLSTLGWRMAAVTPFHYLPCFSSRLDRHDGCSGGGHDPARVALKSIGFIFATTEADSVLDYRPSTMAAAAILAASYGALLTKEALDFLTVQMI